MAARSSQTVAEAIGATLTTSPTPGGPVWNIPPLRK